LFACNPPIEIPKFNDCLILADSFFCIDERIDSEYIEDTIREIEINDNISSQNKAEMIEYFNSNKKEIIRTKEFTIPFKFIAFFRGHTTISPLDRASLEDFNTDLIDKYERLRVRCGRQNRGDRI
jgi:hypothetical protein